MAGDKKKIRNKKKNSIQKPSEYAQRRKEVAEEKAREAAIASGEVQPKKTISKTRRRLDRISTFLVAAGIVLGLASYVVMAREIDLPYIGYAAMGFFFAGTILVGKEGLFILAIGAGLGGVLAAINDSDPVITIVFVWALFYMFLLFAGYMSARKLRR